MKLGIKHIAFVMLLVFLVFVGGNVWAINGVNPVEIDGDRLLVHVEGMALGELLMIVEDLTGVQFNFDESVAEKITFVDFKRLPLSEGINKIIYPFNYAKIYDDSGKLRRVIILDRWKGSEMKVPREGETDSLESPQLGRPHTLYFTRRGSSDSSASPKGSPLGKGSLHLERPPLDRAYSVEGSPDRKDQVMDGPPLDRRYLVGGPPNPQTQILDGPPDVKRSGYPTLRDSEDSLMDGPPLDRPYTVDGPPVGESK